MERRKFFKTSTKGVLAASMLPIVGELTAQTSHTEDVAAPNWNTDADGQQFHLNRKKTITADVVVVGAGMAGICAAVSSARMGNKTVLIQDRPVLGGNASSEIRVTVNGVQSLKNKHIVERETGVLEEMLIENWHFNEQESYPVWDHVLYDFVKREKNLELFLNTQAYDVVKDGDKIKSVFARQTTTEMAYTFNADVFIDSSGDGFMAAMAGAEYRIGREGKEEFGESFAPDVPDNWVMGDCIMMVTKDMGRPIKFNPPAYAIPFDSETAFKDKHRKIKQVKEGFWWVEIGSNNDIIGEREEIKHKLLARFYGVWDHIKNSGNFPEAENIALDWIGSVPGRRESRRFMGDYILTQPDMEEYRHFNDTVAYGGWSLDEHCPGGIENLTEPASYFHSRFEQVYEIPFRCLYSKNVSNLMMAGRNVSVSHMALSSSRIIATCALMGQAVGTASALCVQHKATPREIGEKYINDLQEQLLRDDSYLPNRPANDKNDKAKQASVIFGSSTISGDVKNLVDGVGRDEVEKIHHWQADGLQAELQLEWKKNIDLSSVEFKFDTNLQRKMMMHKNPAKNKGQVIGVPPELVKSFTVEAREKGSWKTIAEVKDNRTRLVKVNFSTLKTNAIRVTFNDTHGDPNIKLFEVRCY
ncbi:FAD-dependent oxidoreductase [Cellulophaga sp. 20_2_10]|uniref:FAD-dependent oxidoreductase n=1 Tax=Cellulophaga sp. 20_2_10 TaxID=2942476 RepID=UPI00201AFB1E|nr:FAD-dependent oxidoreductase [Cellulophaga sp. 20_2_10]MCL5245323.1 FAD-dependent oxidoreductase [Cellulophaga sp. 20_2_10]